MRLRDRVAIVTGSGDGIGRAVARRFAAEGARVVVAELDEASGRQVADETGGLFVRTDVRSKPDVLAMVDAAVRTWGTVDVLVNNAWGGGSLGRVERKSDDELDHAMAIGFHSPRWAMQAVFPHMRAQGRGAIVNMCSLNGVNAHVGTADYNCAKEALRTLTRTAAREWARYGIVANVICPAAKTAPFLRLIGGNPELEAAADASNPMGRMGDPDADIAPVAVFLAGDDARYLTGNTLFVDGGAHINGVAWAPELPE